MTVHERRCRTCRGPVLWGDDDLGIEVTVDVETIGDPVAELEVIVSGRRTYTLHASAGQLAHRSAGRIVTHPAGTRPRTTVHPAHDCEGTRP